MLHTKSNRNGLAALQRFAMSRTILAFVSYGPTVLPKTIPGGLPRLLPRPFVHTASHKHVHIAEHCDNLRLIEHSYTVTGESAMVLLC